MSGDQGRIEGGNVSFVKDMTQFSKVDYARARDQYLSRISAIVHPVAVYEYGTVTTAGISDLDFIIVTDEDVRSRQLAQVYVDEDVRCLIDKPIFLSSRLFEKIQYLFYLGNLEHILGSKLSIEQVGGPQRSMLYFAMFADAGQRLLHTLTKLHLDQRVSTHTALLKLRSVTHSIELARKIGVAEGEEARNFESAVSDVRRLWFENEDYELLGRLLSAAPRVLLELFRRVADGAHEMGWWEGESEGGKMSWFQFAPTSFTVFGNTSGGLNALAGEGWSGPTVRLPKVSADFTLSTIVVPYEYCSYVEACKGTGEGPVQAAIDRHLSKHADEGLGVSGGFKSMIETRIQLGCNHWKFISERKLLWHGQFPLYGIDQSLIRPVAVEPMLRQFVPASSVAMAYRLYFRRMVTRRSASRNWVEAS